MSQKKLRQQQHRPGKDGVVKARDFARVKRENHALQKQVARLRKQVAKATAETDGFAGVDRTTAPVDMSGPILSEAGIRDAFERAVCLPCPKCDDHPLMKRVDLGRVTLYVCAVCKYRQKAAAI